MNIAKLTLCVAGWKKFCCCPDRVAARPGHLFYSEKILVQVDRAAFQDLHRDFVALLIGAGQAVALAVQDKLQDGAQLRLDGPVLADAVPPVEVILRPGRAGACPGRAPR